MILQTQHWEQDYFTKYDSSSVEALMLINGLNDPSPQVRETTGRYFMDAGDLSLPYLERALTLASSAIRWEAVKILSNFKSHSALPLLVSALADKVGGISWLAAEGLLNFQEAGIAAVLTRLGATPPLEISQQLLIHILNQPHLQAFDVLEPLVRRLTTEHVDLRCLEVDQIYQRYKASLRRNHKNYTHGAR